MTTKKQVVSQFVKSDLAEARLREGASLRVAALKLLKKAAMLDRMEPFLVEYGDKHGAYVEVLWHPGEPSESDAVESLGINFKPGENTEEFITIKPQSVNDFAGVTFWYGAPPKPSDDEEESEGEVEAAAAPSP